MSTKTLYELYCRNNDIIEEKKADNWSKDNGGLIKDDIESVCSLGGDEVLINCKTFSMEGDLFKDFNLSENEEIGAYLEGII
jgi:hypothetical protein